MLYLFGLVLSTAQLCLLRAVDCVFIFSFTFADPRKPGISPLPPDILMTSPLNQMLSLYNVNWYYQSYLIHRYFLYTSNILVLIHRIQSMQLNLSYLKIIFNVLLVWNISPYYIIQSFPLMVFSDHKNQSCILNKIARDGRLMYFCRLVLLRFSDTMFRKFRNLVQLEARAIYILTGRKINEHINYSIHESSLTINSELTRFYQSLSPIHQYTISCFS